jgi:hypothetical protein
VSHLSSLGCVSRSVGGAGIREARSYCADALRRSGFDIAEHSFEFSAFPAAWAMPIAGAGAAIAAGILHVARHEPALLAATRLVLLVVVVVLAVLGRRGVLDFPLMRRRGVNLQAVRRGVTPTVWLVAHLDSKWQPVSMIARVAGVVGTSIGLIAMLVLTLRPPANDWAPLAAMLFTWISSVPLMLSVVGARNHGTLDNASGVATVLEAAESIPASARVGVMITDAEELALAGARAWAKSVPASVALNCDSVDDDGPLVVMYSRRRPDALIARLAAAADVESQPVRVLRLIPGILTDSVALADAGWDTLTLSRGTLRTLRRIHTSRDTLATMTGAGIAGAARVLARTATELG